MHAHVLNLQNPGCYRTELNTMLENNGLPKMWFPEDPDSASVLGGKTTKTKTTEQVEKEMGKETEEVEGATALAEREMTTDQARTRHVPMQVIEDRQEYTRKDKEGKKDPRTQPKESKEQGKEQRVVKRKEQRTHSRTEEIAAFDPEEETIIDADELRLTIYITNKQHFPTKTPKRGDIAKGIEQRTHKYVFENRKYNEEYIEYLIKVEKIEISKEDFKLVDMSKFKKIRNGPAKSSPHSAEGYKKIIK